MVSDLIDAALRSDGFLIGFFGGAATLGLLAGGVAYAAGYDSGFRRGVRSALAKGWRSW